MQKQSRWLAAVLTTVIGMSAIADQTIVLPMQSILATEVKGQLRLVSNNGRYIFTGEVYDVWSEKTLISLDDFKASRDRMQLKRFMEKIDDLDPVVVGDGAEKVIVAIDPLLVPKALVEQIEALQSKYRFYLLNIPTKKESMTTVVKLSCLNKEDVWGVIKTNQFPPVQKPCREEALRKRVLSAHLLNIEGTPWIVAPNGQISRGLPPSLESWLGLNKIEDATNG